MDGKNDETKGPKDIISDILGKRYRLKCKTINQKKYSKLIGEKEIIIASGPAGVGKTFVSVAKSIELIQNKTSSFNKIIISTPAEEAGENLGYLPGNLREKMEPYLASTLDVFDKIIGKKKRIELESNGILEIQPLGFIRGKSIDNSILLMEEAQNMSPDQMKTLLTRIGYNSKFIISGDLEQSDRYSSIKKSGLYDAIERHKNIDEIGFIEFDVVDVVRNPLITKIINNYKINSLPVQKEKVITYEPIMSSDITKPKSIINNILKWFLKKFKW